MRANGRGAAILADFAVQYLRVYAICSPVTTIVFAMDNFLKICGKINTSMFLNIFMSVLSMGLEFLFLAGFKMGAYGRRRLPPVSVCLPSVLLAACSVFKGRARSLNSAERVSALP